MVPASVGLWAAAICVARLATSHRTGCECVGLTSRAASLSYIVLHSPPIYTFLFYSSSPKGPALAQQPPRRAYIVERCFKTALFADCVCWYPLASFQHTLLGISQGASISILSLSALWNPRARGLFHRRKCVLFYNKRAVVLCKTFQLYLTYIWTTLQYK